MIIIQGIILIIQVKTIVHYTLYLYESSAKVPKYLELELLVDPLHPRRNFVYYDSLQLHYRKIIKDAK